jgi:hypothetical protein
LSKIHGSGWFNLIRESCSGNIEAVATLDIPELNGPFRLTNSNIAIHVRKGTLGAFVLGPLRHDGHLTVRRTGGSRADMAGDLRGHIGAYDAFGFTRAADAREALATECRLYHNFEPADNAGHPEKPPGAEWACPICGA